MNTQISAVVPEIIIHNNRAVTTSISVADYFEKSHDNVLKKIRAVMIDCDPSWRLVNFNETSYTRENPNGGPGIATPMFELTRDAFVLIVMGFTGKKALQWKIDYINAFNAMEAELLKSVPALPTYPPFSDDYANRAEIIYYQDFRPIFCRIMQPGEEVISHESMKEWLEKQGLVFFTREELRTMTHERWLMICG